MRGRESFFLLLHSVLRLWLEWLGSFLLLMVLISPNFQKWTRHYCAIADEKLSFSDDIEQSADEDSSKVMAVFYCLSIFISDSFNVYRCLFFMMMKF